MTFGNIRKKLGIGIWWLIEGTFSVVSQPAETQKISEMFGKWKLISKMCW